MYHFIYCMHRFGVALWLLAGGGLFSRARRVSTTTMLRSGALGRSKVLDNMRPAIWKAQTRTAVFRHGRMVEATVSTPTLSTGKPLTWGGYAPVGLRVLAVASTALAFYITYWASTGQESERPPVLNLDTFTRAVVHSITQDPSHMVVRMSIPQQFLPKDASHLAVAGAIRHIYIRDDDMQVERPYTPLSGIGADGKIVLWVRKYAGGEVSNWLSRRKRNESVGVRGPVLQWDWQSGAGPCDELILVRPHFISAICPFRVCD